MTRAQIKVPLLYVLLGALTLISLSVAWNMALRNNNVYMYELIKQQNDAIQHLGGIANKVDEGLCLERLW